MSSFVSLNRRMHRNVDGANRMQGVFAGAGNVILPVTPIGAWPHLEHVFVGIGRQLFIGQYGGNVSVVDRAFVDVLHQTIDNPGQDLI